MKRITKSAFFRKILGFLAYLYIVFCYKTTSWVTVNFDLQEENTINDAVIYAFWHGRLAMMPYVRKHHKKMNVLISNHSDGQIIKNAMSHFNFNTISGSSQKNSFAAIKKIISALKNHEYVAITPDGSRGPAQEINSNIIEIAKITQVPIIPMIFSISSCIILRSWDSFMLPLPFSKGVFVYGKSITIPKTASKEEISSYKDDLGKALNSITLHADMLMKKA